MPGVVGLITKMPREQAEPDLLRMVEALRHEPFYRTGTWIDESLGVYLGWSIREGSFSDDMPLGNEQDDVVLVFSGEEFPELGTINRLKERGHELGSKGPSYLVHLYEEDPTFPAVLNGRFHGVLTDRTRQQTILFNDRYGMERIYYHEGKNAVYFAAEAKSILAVCPELRRVDERGLGEFLACGCVLENRTMFQGIHVLPPASVWTFRDGSIERKRAYFEPKQWEEQPRLDAESYYREFRGVFSRNLPRYFSGGERIGMSLTGGLDSRMIMAWRKPAAGSLPCYTFGDEGGVRECRDVVVAREVARACEQSHEVIKVGEEFFSQFAYYAERTVYLTDGCVEVIHSPDLYLNQQVRQIAPVRMTGNYGSEVLRRAVAFGPEDLTPGLFCEEVSAHMRTAADTYSNALQGNIVSFAVFRQAPWHHYGLLALEQTQLSLRSPYLDNDLVRAVFRAPDSALSNGACLRLIEDGDAALRTIPTDRGLNGHPAHLSAAAYRAFLEFLFRAEYKYDSGMPQWVSRIDHLFSPLRLERLFLGWHKFHHFRIWYRDRLSDYVREMLLDPRTLSRPYLCRRQVEAIVDAHVNGERNYTREIHKLLTVELLHRLFVDQH